MTLIALSLSLVAAQAAQAPPLVDPNIVVFQGALTQFAMQQTLYLELTGSITYRGKTTPLASNLSWSSSLSGTTLTQQVELQSYVNGVMIKRLVGDGNTFWAYDLSAHQYSATSYGGTGLGRPDTYTTDLLNDLNWAAAGADAYLTKLLRQIYSTANPNYTSWMPGVISVALQQDLPVTDPVNPYLSYMSTPSGNYYMYDGSPKRSIVFEIAAGLTSAAGSPPAGGLLNIFFNQVDIVARNPRLTQWQITPYTGATFATDIFQPYSGKKIKCWRPVVAPKPVSN